ncbi:hypothetical protein WA538_002522 [Blastocystis sp. DL]
MQSVGGSYLKFIRKQFFVLFYFFTLLLTIALYCILRGSLYVVAITLLCVALFEFIAYFLFGFLSKKRVTVKLVLLSLLLLFSIVFTMLSNRHGYITCNSPLSISNHTHHSLSCSEYTTFAFLHDVIPSIMFPSPSKRSLPSTDSHAEIHGTTLVSFSCPNALKQAKIQSILADMGSVQQWLRNLPPNDRSAGEAVLESYRRRFARRGAIAQSYQPLRANMTVSPDCYIYDCKGQKQVLTAPTQGVRSPHPSFLLLAFDRLSRGSFLNALPRTVTWLKELRTAGYCVFEFSEYHVSPRGDDSLKRLLESFHPEELRSVSVASDACEDWVGGAAGGVANDGTIRLCLRQALGEGDGDSVAEAFRFINDTQSVSREHGGSFISVMSLHPQWPFERLDKQMTQMLRSMEFRGEEAPVIAFVGIRGNAGYAMEPIPTKSRESRNPVFVLCVPKWLATEYPEMAGNLAENVDASVDERVVFDSLRDLLYYPVREEGAFHVVGVCVEVVVA